MLRIEYLWQLVMQVYSETRRLPCSVAVTVRKVVTESFGLPAYLHGGGTHHCRPRHRWQYTHLRSQCVQWGVICPSSQRSFGNCSAARHSFSQKFPVYLPQSTHGLHSVSTLPVAMILSALGSMAVSPILSVLLKLLEFERACSLTHDGDMAHHCRPSPNDKPCIKYIKAA